MAIVKAQDIITAVNETEGQRKHVYKVIATDLLDKLSNKLLQEKVNNKEICRVVISSKDKVVGTFDFYKIFASLCIEAGYVCEIKEDIYSASNIVSITMQNDPFIENE